MPTPDPLSYLQAILTKEFGTRPHPFPCGPASTPCLVTLSRDYGAGGELIARKLAESLGIPLYDHHILDKVAEKAKIDRFKFEQQDESVSAAISTFLFSLLTGTAGDMETYRRCLYETVLELAQGGGLFVGRGAHLILSAKRVFRVRVVGSRSVCARRVAAERGTELPEAEQRVFEVNNKRHKFIDNLFSNHYKRPSLELAKNFDLIVNTDHIDPEGAVPVILLAMQQAGFEVFKSAAKP
jgi:cytidylate kinase